MNAEPPFYLVWREGGRSPAFKHPSITAAENEAERLASMNPGESFYVLIPASRAVERRVSFERYDVLAPEIPF